MSLVHSALVMIGRNDPCRCGSGRKYKHCCLRTNEAADFRRAQLRAAEGRLVPELFELALGEYGPELMESALDEFFVWDGVPEDYEEWEEFGSFFVPWFVYEFASDPLDPDRPAGAPDESIASLFLRRRADRLSPVERAFLASAAASPLSFYAVSRIVPGHELALHDILTGSDIVVKERNLTAAVQPGALLFTRVVTVDDTSIMSGSAPLLLPPQWHLPILDFRDEFAGKGKLLTRDAVRDLDIELRQLYFDIDDQISNPRMPELRNTDGDPLVFTALTYRLQCTPLAAFRRLNPLSRTRGSDAHHVSDEAFDDHGDLRAVTIQWMKQPGRRRESDDTVLGTIAIDGEHLEVNVNSKQRAQRIQRQIAKRLGADAVLEGTKEDSIEQLIADRKETPRDRLDEAEHERLQLLPEVQDYFREQGRSYWDQWLDSRLPALGDRTPRDAALTSDGRERLEALFADFSWKVGRGPNAMAPDVAALRAKLGLA